MEPGHILKEGNNQEGILKVLAWGGVYQIVGIWKASNSNVFVYDVVEED
jgi:hypothetical protein